MSNNLESFVLNRFDQNQIETGYLNSLLANNPVLELSPKQIDSLEQTLQANLGYRPGQIGCLIVPLYNAENTINPLQVTYFPKTDSDFIPNNRAIANIGVARAYWNLIENASKSGASDFFQLLSFNLLPIYLKQNDEAFIQIQPIRKDSILYNKYTYRSFVWMINYGGDGDFVGTDYPKTYIKVSLNNEITNVLHSDIGVSTERSTQLFNSRKQLRNSWDAEVTEIIQSGYPKFSDDIKEIIDSTKQHTQSLSGIDLAQCYIKYSKNYDDKVLDDSINNISQFVKKEFSERTATSPTVMAVHKMVEALDNMYQEAIPYYQK